MSEYDEPTKTDVIASELAVIAILLPYFIARVL